MLLSQCHRLDCPAYLLDSSATSVTQGQEILLELKVFWLPRFPYMCQEKLLVNSLQKVLLNKIVFQL